MKEKLENLFHLKQKRNINYTSIDLDHFFDTSLLPIYPPVKFFFSNCILTASLEIGDIRWFGKREIMMENEDLLPGCQAAKFGVVSIAADAGGDVFSCDCRSGMLYKLSLEKFNSDSISPGWKNDFSGFLPDIPITYENIVATADHSFENFDAFLEFLEVQS